jgi:hypothetical protein
MPARHVHASLKSGRGEGATRILQWGHTLLLQPPSHAAAGRWERAFLLCADVWLPHPRAAQPNLNRSHTTPIPTEYKVV